MIRLSNWEKYSSVVELRELLQQVNNEPAVLQILILKFWIYTTSIVDKRRGWQE